MNPLKKIFFSLICLSLLGTLGCTQKKDCCTVIDTAVDIFYKTHTGESLINSTSQYAAENIKIFYKNGDEYKYMSQSNLDNPNMYFIDKNDADKTILTVFPSNYYEGNFSTTLVQLNEGIVDTLLCEFNLNGSNEICKNVWVNGIKMESRSFEIEK